MFRRYLFNGAVLVALVAALFGLNRAVARAAPALNDNFADATVIGSLPFTDTVDLTEGTTEPGEPQYCYSPSNTAWYAYTPAADSVVQVDTQGSSFYNSAFNVYQAGAPSFSNLTFMGCAAYGSTVTLNVQAGQTYYVQAGVAGCGYPPCGGVLQLNVRQVPPPPNDDLANAIAVSSLPFEQPVDMTATTREANEPHASCGADYNSRTAWYAFTPAASGSVMADFAWTSFYGTGIAAYTGDPSSGLTEVGCRSYGSPLVLSLNAGTTYYFQVAAFYTSVGTLQFRLQAPPPPQANFGYYPFEATILDTLQFYDNSYDPAGMGIQTWAWEFGDGATATDNYPTHRYSADGDYTVRLTVTTADGRTASANQTVHVRTHDVAITKFQVPNAASVGQTRQIVISLRNINQPETVRVELYRSTPSGFQLIGTLEQFVPVRSGNRTTDFQFSYTFAASDATAGKVNFMANAVILGNQDRLPTDNQAISTPTKVGR
jgi:PKD repeat protein